MKTEFVKALIGFGGFGGPEIALREAGFETLSIEFDLAIAEVSRANGNNVITADLLDMNPADFIGWLLYHFSPPCPNFSLANHAGSESELDIALARKICSFIRIGRPEYFTLENVWMYRKSLSWFLIWYTLLEEGYGVEGWHLNAADYGVPQSRRRMIVIARRDGRQPAKPWPTHSKTGDMFTSPWNGWYGVIEDLILGLPETQLAKWQMDRMPEELKTSLVMTDNTNRNGVDNVAGRGWLEKGSPANTVTTMSNGSLPRAFLLGQGQRSEPKDQDQPADTITGNGNQTGIKAFVMASANTGANNGKGTIRGEDEPMFTVLANSAEKNSLPKAFIIGDQRGQIRSVDSPVFTVCASDKLAARILVSGKVVSMTPRCLARFQDFPDWFVLPGEPGLIDNPVILADKRSPRELGCRGIGNALPPGMYRSVLRSFELEVNRADLTAAITGP